MDKGTIEGAGLTSSCMYMYIVRGEINTFSTVCLLTPIIISCCFCTTNTCYSLLPLLPPFPTFLSSLFPSLTPSPLALSLESTSDQARWAENGVHNAQPLLPKILTRCPVLLLSSGHHSTGEVLHGKPRFVWGVLVSDPALRPWRNLPM